MRSLVLCGAGLVFVWGSGRAEAQQALVTLGRPQPLAGTSALMPASYAAPAVTLSAPRPVVRGQSPDMPPVTVSPPPPPPPPGPAPGPGGLSGPAVFPGGPVPGLRANEEAYNCGMVTNDADMGSFWTRCGDRMRRCWGDVTGAVSGGIAEVSDRTMFQSDHQFDAFISPVTNPHYFEDPRALTEFRSVFMWQRTRDETPFFAGGDNYFLTLQGRVALTPWISLVVNRLGWTWINPDAPVPGVVEEGNGFSELHLGPKVTFYRNDATCTVMALGLNFEIPIGSDSVFQDTGDLSLSPYFSIAQRVWSTPYGSVNFMNTTGYSFAVDSQRTDFFYVSAHLDFDVFDQHRWYPLVELNWTRYTFDGGARDFGFEGNNLFNFGSDGVAGNDDLTLAIGTRYKWSEALQFGIAAEFSVLGGGRHMDAFRLTTDMILRY